LSRLQARSGLCLGRRPGLCLGRSSASSAPFSSPRRSAGQFLRGAPPVHQPAIVVLGGLGGLHRIQDKYAKKYGTRRLQFLAPQRDLGKKEEQGKRKREGKKTVTAFKVKRRKLLGQGVPLPFGRNNVFRCSFDGVKEKVLEEQTDTFHHQNEKARKKHDDKKKAVQSLVTGRSGPRHLAEATDLQKRQAWQMRQ
jgi:hypothetical protein